ncbi:hypothetical protein JQN63_17870 [Delftia lacustris]|uniref:YqaJ viral recombinase domain-containing protein n=2 Tax=Delftia tsuruhatensis TaxID=180282 RepID=A0ABM6DZF9_9BURK|nr:hypothetical protein [Delftia lacustris]AOV00409.1 hypothetical protein BI380_03065 [Delftia tsuruhatensis]QRI88281.1 hypothetical protein JQN63_17870 [Delftia lacustris]
MRPILFRCSSIGRLMTAPASIDPALLTPEVEAIQAKKERTGEEKALLEDLKLRTLSEGAKSYIRELVRQEIWGVDFSFSSKYTEKGKAVEAEGLALLNRVRGLNLVKNTERRSDGQITGEADTVDLGPRRCGHDLKCSWSLQTFPAFVRDCEDALYAWQMRGYMRLWDLERWEVNYVMVNTPEDLLGQHEPQHLHLVEHIPEHMRLTTWAIERDRALEAQMDVKLELARIYYTQCIAEFAATHPAHGLPAASPTAPWQPPLELIDTQQPPRVLGHVQDDGRALMLPEQPAAPQETAPALNIGQINKRLGIFDVKATTAAALGIPTVKDRSAVHLPASSFTDFCNGLIAHIADVRDSYQVQP